MKTLYIAAFLVACTIQASAQQNRGLQDEKQRIRAGVVSGQLTTTEAARLRAQTAHIRAEAIQYKTNDGRIDRRERADLRRDQRKLNRRICIQKTDRQRRF
jgi:hypothetical protein